MSVVNEKILSAASSPLLSEAASDSKGRRGTAFIIEALLLVVFLGACCAVFMQLLGMSGHLSEESLQTNAAVRAAANAAEKFAHDPVSFDVPEPADGLSISADVWPERVGTGVLYHATIAVLDADGSELYQLQTAKFVPVAAAALQVPAVAGATAATDAARAADAQAGGTNG